VKSFYARFLQTYIVFYSSSMSHVLVWACEENDR